MGSGWVSSRRAVLVALLCAGVGGACGCLGPSGVRQTRSRYNDAIQTTNNQELLLNLVRLRYNENPGFLPVTSLNSQFEFDAGALTRLGTERGEKSNYGQANLGFSDRPTITFAPQRSPELTKALLTHLDLDTLYLFARQGWDQDRLYRIMIRTINGVENAGNAGGPTPHEAPEFAEFRCVAGLLHRLDREHGLIMTIQKRQADVPNAVPVDAVGAPDLLAITRAGLGVRPRGDGKGYVLTQTVPARVVKVAPNALHSHDFLEVARLLRLDPTLATFDIEDAPEGQLGAPEGPGAERTMRITTRSIFEVMCLLAQAVSVPEEHVCSGVAIVTFNADGSRFDWGDVLGDLFHICVSKKKPHNAWTAVNYRGYWYYIDDADVSSKITIELFNELFRLQRIGAAEGQPALTLPVGR